MENIKKKLSDFLSPQTARMWIMLLPTIQTIDNIKAKFRLIDNASNCEELCDYLCELRYALIFKFLGFDIIAEPLGKEGPDFRIDRDDMQIMLECMRFRRVHPGPFEEGFSDDSTDIEYGDINRDIQKACSKIKYKDHQVTGYPSLIAIWNNDGDLEELEVSLAIRQLIADSNAKRYPLPQGLMAVVYGSSWKNQVSGKQVFCFEVVEPAPMVSNLFEELRSIDVDRALNAQS
jgi:hypothetical protein